MRLIDRLLYKLVRDEFRWAILWLLRGNVTKFVEVMESGLAHRRIEARFEFGFDGTTYYQK